VDDELVVCKSVIKILSKDGHQVDYALSAPEALEKMKAGPYDVVITDLKMPGMTGMDLLRNIKRSYLETSVVVITGYATVRSAVEAMKLGAFDYIPKPFTTHELSSSAARALERRRLYGKEPTERMVPAEAVEVEAVAEEKIEIPPVKPELIGYYGIMEHSWARIESDGSVRIGMDEIFKQTAGDIVHIDLPFEGDDLEQGQACVRVTSSGLHIHKLWTPVGGQVVEVNYDLLKNVKPAVEDPYGKGWMLRIAPSNLEEDLKNLVRIE
jgi:glycine cleavage system H lipoate-binding protein/CheY-like chemotaxis protein